ncbi:hypothetical protein [Nostoc parmelioides]|nr:hypothetical protein [Nostoc parmelioides]
MPTKTMIWWAMPTLLIFQKSNTSEEDAMNRVSTNGLFVPFFFQIGIT